MSPVSKKRHLPRKQTRRGKGIRCVKSPAGPIRSNRADSAAAAIQAVF